MANFFLIDQSLQDASGHHADYVQCIARAANEMGFLTTIGTHRHLTGKSARETDSLHCLGTVHRVFHNPVYHHDSYLAGLRRMKRSQIPNEAILKNAGFLQNIRHRIGFYRHWRRREKLIRQFAVDCEKMFRTTMFTPHDHAFFAAVSELELMGLAVYLSKQPRSMQAQWHLQFHFNLFNGRPPEYESQSSTGKAVRSCFMAALSRLSNHAVNFYTTSDELADQYNQLGVGDFESLPYPVAREFAPLQSQRSFAGSPTILKFANQPSSQISSKMIAERAVGLSTIPISNYRSEPNSDVDANRAFDRSSESFGNSGQWPIRIALPGGIRREKGFATFLQPLVNQIEQSLLANGKVQLFLQRPIRKSWQPQKIELKLSTDRVGARDYDPIVYARHPLPREEYIDLIRTSDAGLLFYDSEVYYGRRAGILGELLSVGKPVIVPAGSWLAEQIQEPIYQHADRQFPTNETRRQRLSEFRWNSLNVPMAGGILSFDAGRRPFHFECDVQPTECVAGFSFDWHWPNEKGIYCRVDLTQLDANGATIGSACQTVGHRERKSPIALFSIDPTATKLKFSLKNAFHHSTASIKNVEVITSSTPGSDSHTSRVPIGAVGIIASDREQLAYSVSELVEHFDHYRTSAEAFSHSWFAQHDPKRTMAHLIASEFPAERVA